MQIKKISEGYATQIFNTETKQWESQEFTACGQVDYEGETNNTIDPEENGMLDAEGDEPYLPFDMVQPNSIESCRESIQEDLMTFLDGLPNDGERIVCQIVCDNFKKFFEKKI
jgi:hypothetical protein